MANKVAVFAKKLSPVVEDISNSLNEAVVLLPKAVQTAEKIVKKINSTPSLLKPWDPPADSTPAEWESAYHKEVALRKKAIDSICRSCGIVFNEIASFNLEEENLLSCLVGQVLYLRFETGLVLNAQVALPKSSADYLYRVASIIFKWKGICP